MEWISVKDRLPENSGRYLVRHLNFPDASIIEYSDGWQATYFVDGLIQTEGVVTHWMPQPEPPFN